MYSALSIVVCGDIEQLTLHQRINYVFTCVFKTIELTILMKQLLQNFKKIQIHEKEQHVTNF